MFQKIVSKKATIAVVGLGYVGLPIALALAKKVKVIGFDINAARIAQMKNAIDPSGELPAEDFKNAHIFFTADPEDLKKANFYIIAVPTPIDEHTTPDLKPLLAASTTVGKALKKGDYVVYESTVYPGCTEEDCIPILEKESNLIFNKDFKVGYSPERINPGDKEHTLQKVMKVVSGGCPETLENVAQVYELVVEAGVHKASSIKVAEAAKIIENTQRDVNIALMNELSMIFNKMQINTYEVLEAANTKWNFLKFFPGLVGGHCIGVDPYYLTYKAKELGFDPKIILSGRAINDGMGAYIAKEIVHLLLKQKKNIAQVKILVMGVTFKENVGDIRNSKVIDLINELNFFSIQTHVIDECANPEELKKEYGLTLTTNTDRDYDAVILAVPHQKYLDFTEAYFEKITQENALFIDIKGIYRNKINKLVYWSL